ncbi:hypothetical protein M378DRAFT_974870 [Amanita muscaria Koide BX008]|uniref:Uncharacterized protein n=1 Tax=Amanita muscaria (strain Koide BX008) TaxID=946122 RepID=A0A0C2XFV1_AMAMK|nr:hypothetical protein M378DRAFT_974870 [Amanita muscaria Koide BX008]
MSKFLSLWKRNHEQDPAVDPSPNIAFRKIHPNLDSLVAQLEDDGSSKTPQGDAFSSNTLDFIPLKPKPPERDRCNSMSLQPDALPEVQVPRVAPFGPDDAWSTFGRNIKPPTESEDAQAPASIPTTSHRQGTPVTRRYMHLQTPTSMSRSSESSSPLSQSTQHNCTSPSSRNDSASTPHTSEKRLSPASYNTFGRRPSSQFLAETPPPLPPLDHPAFHSATQVPKLLNSSDIACNGTLEKQPRHSASLPSMVLSGRVKPRVASRTSKSIRSTRKRHYEIQNPQIDGSNDTFIFRPSNHDREISAESSKRPRSHSKSSHGSIQTSAERRSREITREARDMREIKRSEKEGDLSILGKACGGNVHSCAEISRLGDPFLLQNALSHLVLHSDRHGNKPDLPFIHDTTRSENGERKTYEMNQPDVFSNNHGQLKDSQSQAKQVSRARRSSPPRQGPTLLVPPSLSFTSPTPGSSPITPFLPLSPGSNLQGPSPPLKSSIRSTTGKRKADDAEVEACTPSKDSRREHRATFAPEQRPHRISENSGSSYAPTSFKRVRLSTSSDSRSISRTPTKTSLRENLGSGNTGSWSSRGSSKRPQLDLPHRQPSRHSMQSQRPSNNSRPPRETSRRRSLSGASIPISALVSPHAPSVARSATFHMHDPHRPAPIQSTSWAPSLPVPTAQGSRWVLDGWVERGGSPVHAWLFFLGFFFFPVWWAAAFVGIPKTRRIGEGGMEKGVILDDPQVEHDSKSWRTRCRIMALISFFTYIPFIILVAVFVRH